MSWIRNTDGDNEKIPACLKVPAKESCCNCVPALGPLPSLLVPIRTYLYDATPPSPPQTVCSVVSVKRIHLGVMAKHWSKMQLTSTVDNFTWRIIPSMAISQFIFLLQLFLSQSFANWSVNKDRTHTSLIKRHTQQWKIWVVKPK